MTNEELIKELELLADSCDSNHALETNGYNRGVLDSINLVNKYLCSVASRSFSLEDLKKEFEAGDELVSQNWHKE